MRFSNFFSRLGVAISACLLIALSLTLTEAKAFASAFDISNIETVKAKSHRQYLTLDAMGAPRLAANANLQDAVEIYAIAVSGNDIYFGGSFESIGGIAARGIARFNVVSGKWFPLGGSPQASGNGVTGFVNAITIVGTNLYVSGAFSGGYNNVGSFVSANCVARFNTTNSTWAALGTGTGPNANGFNGDVIASVSDGANVYFGGGFLRAFNSGANFVDVNRVACWNIATSTWSSLGKGIGTQAGYEVFDLEIFGNDLYVGGRFPAVFRADNSPLHVDCIARWNLTSKLWFPMGVDSGSDGTNGVAGDVYALETDGTYLYVGGSFRSAHNSGTNKPPANRVARWNGTTWSTLNGATNVNNNGLDANVRELCFNSGTLYVGGEFENVHNTNGSTSSANYIARWNGTAWAMFGSGSAIGGNGVDGEVRTMAMVGGQLYVGGLFSEAYNNSSSAVAVPGLARWTGTVWTAAGAAAIKSVTMTSAASFAAGETAADAVMTAFGTTLSTGTLIGNTLPLPTNLLNTTISVRDSAGTARAANMFYVSPTQINFLVPAGTAAGTATVTVNSGDGSVSQGTVNVLPVAPGLFTLNANGQGVVAAVALRVRANTTQSYENIATFDRSVTPNKWITTPIDLGPTGERVFLILYGTGIRGKQSSTPMGLTIGGVTAPISFAGPQGQLAGLDQINVEIPRSLIGRKEVDLVFTLGGKTANTVKVSIK